MQRCAIIDESLETWWLAERSEVARGAVVIILVSLVVRGRHSHMKLYACPSQGSIILWRRRRVKVKLAQIVRKFNEEKITD